MVESATRTRELIIRPGPYPESQEQVVVRETANTTYVFMTPAARKYFPQETEARVTNSNITSTATTKPKVQDGDPAVHDAQTKAVSTLDDDTLRIYISGMINPIRWIRRLINYIWTAPKKNNNICAIGKTYINYKFVCIKLLKKSGTHSENPFFDGIPCSFCSYLKLLKIFKKKEGSNLTTSNMVKHTASFSPK